ncbi:MAG: hypothetical protein QM754_21305 [Tepidisphaeraceae bacterium]
MSWKASLVAVVLAAAVCPTLSYAQNQGGGGGNGGGGGGGGRQQRGGGNGGGGGNFDPAQFQQMRLERIKEQLGAQDDEWKVIEPKLSKIMDAQRQAMAGGMGMGGGRGGRGGGGGGGPGGGGQEQTPTTKVGIARAELDKATKSDSASPEDIDKKLQAYRAARTEAQTSLETARKDLKELLTPKQEAILVLNNILE